MIALAPSPTAPNIAAQEEARRFFFALFRDPSLAAGEWYELRCLDCRTEPATPGPRAFFRSITDMVEYAIRLRDRWDVYFGVGTRKCPKTHDMRQCRCNDSGTGPSSRIDHISRLPGAWVDLDVQSPDEPTKRYPTPLDGLEALYALNEPPRVIVSSGAGLHAYWPLAHPTFVLDDIVAVNTGIAATLGVDNCGDAPRILRVPGTFNYKHAAPLPVFLIEPQAPERSEGFPEVVQP